MNSVQNRSPELYLYSLHVKFWLVLLVLCFFWFALVVFGWFCCFWLVLVGFGVPPHFTGRARIFYLGLP